jgi:hypothetical protein
VALRVLAGVFCFVRTLYVLFRVFRAWAIPVGFLFAPVIYVASVFIVFFTTGVFDLLLLVAYVVLCVGLALCSIEARIHGEDVMFATEGVKDELV